MHKDKNSFLPTINPQKINIILKHYERYILKLATRMLYDKTGHLCYEVDEALRRRLETKLITKTLAFKLDSDWKSDTENKKKRG